MKLIIGFIYKVIFLIGIMKILAIGDFQGVFSKELKNKLKKEDFDLVVSVGDYAGIDEWKPYIFEIFRFIKKKKEIPSAEEYFGEKELDKLWIKDFKAGKKVFQELDKLNKPIIYVFGNSDDRWYEYPFGDLDDLDVKRREVIKKLRNFIDINYKKRKYKGISFIGFGGYMDIESFIKDKEFIDLQKKKVKIRRNRIRQSKEKLFSIFSKVKGPSVLVTHYPPYGVFDIIKEKGNPMNGKSAGIKAFSQAIKKFKPKLVLCGHMHEYQGMKKLYGIPVINPGDAAEGKYAIIDWPSLKVRFVK